MTATEKTTDIEIPPGAPCWMDLFSTDVDEAVTFYTGLFGWECSEALPELHGYRYFTKDGKAVGGCILNVESYGAPNGWFIFLRSNDARATAAAAEAHGGSVLAGPMDVEPNGSSVTLRDPGGATISAWQPGTESGFGVLREDYTPIHFELHTREYDKAVQFYRDVFQWTPQLLVDEPGFRYATYADAENPRAGIMDASAYLPEGVPAQWSVYIGVPDVEATLAKVVHLGGTVVQPAEDTPYGKLATASDPTGAIFKLRG